MNYSLEGDYYHTPGTADELITGMEADTRIPPVAKLLAKGELAYLRGDIEELDRIINRAAPYCEDIFDAEICLNMLRGVSAMYRGDIHMWQESRNDLRRIQCPTPIHRDVIDFWIGAYDSHIYDHSSWPDWFCKGRLETLPFGSNLQIQTYYAKYLLTKVSSHIRNGKLRMSDLDDQIITISNLCETMLAASNKASVVSEIRLRLIGAVNYHMSQEYKDAAFCVDRAVELALPDKLYAPLAEYRELLGYLVDDKLKDMDEDSYYSVRSLSNQVKQGWGVIHSDCLNRNFIAGLTVREREIAWLAALGESNEKISEKLNISINTVKTHLKYTFDKIGVSKRSELRKHL